MFSSLGKQVSLTQHGLSLSYCPHAAAAIKPWAALGTPGICTLLPFFAVLDPPFHSCTSFSLPQPLFKQKTCPNYVFPIGLSIAASILTLNISITTVTWIILALQRIAVLVLQVLLGLGRFCSPAVISGLAISYNSSSATCEIQPVLMDLLSGSHTSIQHIWQFLTSGSFSPNISFN